MKIETEIASRCAGNTMTFAASGAYCGEFRVGAAPMLYVGRVNVNKFSEAGGLAAKHRRHVADDRLSGEIDSENVIPFGCEYRVRRHWRIAGNIAELTCDVAADNGGRIAELELEELFFPVPGATVEYLVFGEEAFRRDRDYEGAEMLMMVRVTAPDGSRAEFYAGDDFWRHRAACGVPGASAFHRLTVGDDGVRYTRRVLSIPKEIVPEKRPWRFQSLIALSAPGRPAPEVSECLNLAGCMTAPAARRAVRAFVRRLPAGACAAVRGDFPGLCADGGHEARSGRKLLHGDLAAVFDDWVWAAGHLAGRGASCVMQSGNERFAGSVLLTDLASPPETTVFGDGAK